MMLKQWLSIIACAATVTTARATEQEDSLLFAITDCDLSHPGLLTPTGKQKLLQREAATQASIDAMPHFTPGKEIASIPALSGFSEFVNQTNKLVDDLKGAATVVMKDAALRNRLLCLIHALWASADETERVILQAMVADLVPSERTTTQQLAADKNIEWLTELLASEPAE